MKRFLTFVVSYSDSYSVHYWLPRDQLSWNIFSAILLIHLMDFV